MNLRDLQADHFDEHAPFVPGKHYLRQRGYSVAYILKDAMIGAELDDLGLSPDQRVLDVGCGDSLALDRISSSYGAKGVGVDVSRGSLSRGREQSLHQAPTAEADAYRLPFPNGSFDAAVSFDVLEHVENPARVIREVARVLRPGGKLLCYIVGSRNRFTLNWFITSLLDHLGGDPWGRTGHRPELLVDPFNLAKACVSSGLAVPKLRPFHAFFSLAFDQTLLGFAWIAARLAPAAWERTLGKSIARWWIEISDRIGRAVAPVANWLDRLWTKQGLSNGFLIVVEKPGDGELKWIPVVVRESAEADLEAWA